MTDVNCTTCGGRIVWVQVGATGTDADWFQTCLCILRRQMAIKRETTGRVA